MLLLAGHEKGEVLEPRDVPGAEVIEGATILSSCIVLKTCGGSFQHASLPADDASEIDGVQRKFGLVVKVGSLKDSFGLQLCEIDKKGVPRIRGETLKW